MKFSCEQAPLAYALHKCASIARPSSTFLANRNIRLDARADGLAISATDTMSTTATYIVREAEIDEQGYILVDGASLSAFVGAQRGYVRANSTPQNKLHITSGANKMFLRSSDFEFLPVVHNEDDLVASVRGEALKELLKISVMADTGNIVSPQLGGTMLMLANKHIYAMSASSGRAGYAWADVRYDGRAKFLLPPMAASRLSYFLHDDDLVGLYRHEGRLLFVTDRFSLVSSEIAGNYPSDRIVEMCSAEQGHLFTVDADELTNILNACSVMYKGAKDNSLKRIRFAADAEYNILNISTAAENDLGQMNWSLAIRDTVGQSFTFKLNALFVDTVLGVLDKLFKSDLMYSGLDNSSITIGISEKTNFIYFTSKDLRAIFTIAPLGPPIITETTDATSVAVDVF
jgi:DNA polymerase III sliding clamp (beta) subunit (PCNA family)